MGGPKMSAPMFQIKAETRGHAVLYEGGLSGVLGGGELVRVDFLAEDTKDTGRVVAAMVQVAGMLLQREREADRQKVQAQLSAKEYLEQIAEAMPGLGIKPYAPLGQAGPAPENHPCPKCGYPQEVGKPCQTCEMIRDKPGGQ